MSIGFLRRIGFVLALGVTLGHALTAKGQEGIFAEFNTTMGSFTCRLEYAYAPKAVANFIGLATGQRPWLDEASGAVRTDPFYDGLIFHRVIQGFVIQGGSRNRQGTDGPGYVFTDEIVPNLTFANTGVLGSANSGTNSNGSQFFLTVGPQTGLNGGYTIFGELTGGTNVVLDINRVGTSSSTDRPTNDVVLRNVVIRRVGTDAENFDINAQGLPVVSNPPLQMSHTGTNQFSFTFSNRPSTENFLYSTTKIYSPAMYTNLYVLTNYFYTNATVVSTNYVTNGSTITTNFGYITNEWTQTLYETNIYATNLVTWTSESLGIEVAEAPITNTFYRTRTNDSSYFRLAQVEYFTVYVPRDIHNRTLTLTFDDDALAPIVINFDGSNGGTYTTAGEPPGTPLKDYTWSQSYFQGTLDPIDFKGIVLSISLTIFFNSPSNGNFTGTVNSDAPYPVSGTFTLSAVQ